MDSIDFLDTKHGVSNLIISVLAVLFLQLIIKFVDLYFKRIFKKQDKRELDMRRAFIAIKLLSGEDWPKIREEIMREDQFKE